LFGDIDGLGSPAPVHDGSVIRRAACNSFARLTSLTAQWVRFISHLADIELEGELFEIVGGQKRIDGLKLVFDPNLSLPFGDITDQAEFRRELVERFVGEDTGQPFQFRNRGIIKFSEPLGDRVFGILADTARELDLPGSPLQASALAETRRLYIEETAVGVFLRLGACVVVLAAVFIGIPTPAH